MWKSITIILLEPSDRLADIDDDEGLVEDNNPCMLDLVDGFDWANNYNNQYNVVSQYCC